MKNLILLLVIISFFGCKKNQNQKKEEVTEIHYFSLTQKSYYSYIVDDNDTIPLQMSTKKFKIDFNEQSYFGLCYDTLSPIDVLMDIDIQGQEIKNIPVSCNGRDVFISKQINWEKVNPVGVKVRTDDEQKLIKKNLNDLSEFIQKTNKICKPKAWSNPACG